MKNSQIITNFGRSFSKIGLQLKKHSPEILIATGVVGTVVSAVMACKATMKVNEVVSELKELIEKIHTATENGCNEAGTEYTVENSKKDLTIAYVQTGIKFVKLYAPAIIIGAASLTGIVASNNILRKRNVALAAAYATVDKGFKEYRSRVVERFGKELDRELVYNVKATEVEEKIVDENGEEQVVKKVVNTANGHIASPYAHIFSKLTSEAWEDDVEYNAFFLRAQEKIANNMLQTRGHLFMNEVLDMLGMQRTKAGQEVGWVYSKDNAVGDNYVDFGICELDNELEDGIVLNFNVDGYVLDLI